MSDSSLRRVVITGLGVVSPIGNTPEEMWDSLQAERSGVQRIASIPTDYLPSPYGAESRDFAGKIDDFGELDPKQKKTIRKGLKVMCREIQMGVAAAQKALHHAGLKLGEFDHDRTGVVCGSDYIMTMPDEFTEGIRSCLNGDNSFDFARWASQGLPKVTPLWLLKYLPNMPASHIAIYNDLRGPNNSITLREASANLAVAEAYLTIQRGWAERIIVGATGTRIHPLRSIHVALQEELASGVDDPTLLSRPFDQDRSGLVLGEGAGAVILEEYASATARGAQILGEVIGYGSSTVLRRDGVAQLDTALENVMRQAIDNSSLVSDGIGHVHAHGLGTRQSDAAEARAIQAAVGPKVSVTAAKSYFGNLGAASGLVELIASLLSLQHDRLFPILNYQTPDPDCPIKAAQTGDAPGDSFLNINVTPQGQASGVAIQRVSS